MNLMANFVCTSLPLQNRYFNLIFDESLLILLWKNEFNFRRDLIDISPALTEVAGAIVDVSASIFD